MKFMVTVVWLSKGGIRYDVILKIVTHHHNRQDSTFACKESYKMDLPLYSKNVIDTMYLTTYTLPMFHVWINVIGACTCMENIHTACVPCVDKCDRCMYMYGERTHSLCSTCGHTYMYGERTHSLCSTCGHTYMYGERTHSLCSVFV